MKEGEEDTLTMQNTGILNHQTVVKNPFIENLAEPLQQPNNSFKIFNERKPI